MRDITYCEKMLISNLFYHTLWTLYKKLDAVMTAFADESILECSSCWICNLSFVYTCICAKTRVVSMKRYLPRY